MRIKEKIKSHWFFQYITYGAVGTVNVIIDICIINILMAITHIYRGKMFFLFKLISFVVYSISGYFMNKRLTFDCKHTKNTTYLAYALTLFIAAMGNGWILSTFTMLSLDRISPRVWANIVNIIASMTTGTISFLVNKFLIFNGDRNKEEKDK